MAQVLTGRSGTQVCAPDVPPEPGVGGPIRSGPILRTKTLGLLVSATPRFEDVVEIVSQKMRSEHQSFLVTFVNPGSLAVAERNPAFRQNLERFDLVLPDGIGMARAVETLNRVPAARVSFDSTSLAVPVLERVREANLPVTLVGGKPGVAERASARLVESFPGLRVTCAFDGYGDLDAKAQEVMDCGARVVICCMGGGAQEEFLLHMKDRGWTGCGFTCGGYFDQLAEGLQYYPAWVDRLDLRWAYRIAKEPRRLWRRYLFDYGRFGLRLTQQLARRAIGRE